MVSEIAVIVKDADKSLKTNFLIYDTTYNVKEDDPVIKDCIEQSILNFQGEPEKITVKITMEVA